MTTNATETKAAGTIFEPIALAVGRTGTKLHYGMKMTDCFGRVFYSTWCKTESRRTDFDRQIRWTGERTKLPTCEKCAKQVKPGWTPEAD